MKREDLFFLKKEIKKNSNPLLYQVEVLTGNLCCFVGFFFFPLQYDFKDEMVFKF